MSSSYAWGAYYEEPFERAEEYIETQYKAFTTDASQLPLIRTAALGSLAFGVKSYGEVVAGGTGLALYYYWSTGAWSRRSDQHDGRNPDGPGPLSNCRIPNNR